MTTFHHGGRIGDLVYALWTVKALGGGKLIVSDFHHPNWSLEIARTMETFLLAQPYVEAVEFVEHRLLGPVDFDLHDAEDDYNPEKFPEWTGDYWPGNCHIAKRYAVHYGLEFDGVPWLDRGVTSRPPGLDFDVIMHVPDYRSLRRSFEWWDLRCALIERGLTVLFTHGVERWLSIEQWSQLILTAKVFLGCVSSMHAIAEGLGKTRLVEQSSGCFNVTPTLCLNGMSNDEVVAAVMERL